MDSEPGIDGAPVDGAAVDGVPGDGVAEVAVFGATGRVGSEVLIRALDAGLPVRAVVRRPDKLKTRHERLRVVTADALDGAAVRRALAATPPVAAVVMAVGSDPLKASTVVTRCVESIVAAMTELGIRRYAGVSGTAQMPATPLGKVTQFAVRRLIRATSDHQGAYDLVAASSLDYVLAGCPYIKDGVPTGRYTRQPGRFPGGYRTISPGDVADFLVREITSPTCHRQIVGIWA